MSPTVATVVFDPVIPLPFIVILWLALSALAVWAIARGGPRLGAGKKTALLLLRWLALTLFCLPLLQPSREEAIPRVQRARLALVALDTSRSMAETDESGSSRLDAGRRLIREQRMVGETPVGTFRLHAFDTESRSVPPEGLDYLVAGGVSTHFDTSLKGILRSLGKDENCLGLFLFSDGHDFEGVPPEQLGRLARQFRTPIYPVPLGRTVHLPDAAVHMVSTRPSTFVKQKARLDALVRFRSFGSQQVRVELVRAGQVIREQKIRTLGDDEVPVGFEVSEDKPGQYEYEIRCAAQPMERDVSNNTAFAYLNVTNARIPVLLLEGEPHWDTSFLLRTLARNDRISLDSAVAVGKNRRQTTRSDKSLPNLGDLTAETLAGYPVIILGRRVENLLDEDLVSALAGRVRDGGTTLVFARGKPGSSPLWEALSPTEAGEGFKGPVSLVPLRGKNSVVPLEVLLEKGTGKLPPLPVAADTGKRKVLSSVEAVVQDESGREELPAMLLRQYGAGQVFQIALEGLWKWSLHAGAEAENNLYDRFWNQLIVNLVARSSLSPSDNPQLMVSKANLEVGEEARFTLHLPAPRDGKPMEFPQPPTFQIFKEGAWMAMVPMTRRDPAGPWEGVVTTDTVGRFKAQLRLPNGTSLECLYAVYIPQSETTDVATDLEYLRRLANVSGGRVLDAASLPGMMETLGRAAAAESAAPPAIRRLSLWDTKHWFWLLCGVFGIEWFLRRRWGLV